MLGNYEEIRSLIDEIDDDVYKFYMKNNKEAGKRAIRVFRKLRDLCDEQKKDMQQIKKII